MDFAEVFLRIHCEGGVGTGTAVHEEKVLQADWVVVLPDVQVFTMQA